MRNDDFPEALTRIEEGGDRPAGASNLRLRLGVALDFEFPAPTPMIAMVNVHPSLAARLERPDAVNTDPSVALRYYRDRFGNWCCRLVAPAGKFRLWTDTIIEDDGLPDAYVPQAKQHAVEDLPPETLQFLLSSRYCESDSLSNEAWRLFGATAPGWARVQAICDFVHGHIEFGYGYARPTRTAAEAYAERRGVCRDFAHLAVAFCRAMNIPARYATGYISDVGQPPPYAAMDLAAWIEVYLSDRWYAFDPRNNDRRIGRVAMAYGRDATDVPITHTFGPNVLTGFRITTEEA